MNDTIAAIATPFGEGAIAMIRVSGPGAVETVNRSLARTIPDTPGPSRLVTTFMDPDRQPLDDVVVATSRAPKTYTGENLVEITCHGGILVTRRILQTLLDTGARLAHPGEFTQRAFMHGKMDLTQAEAVMDLIQARSDLALQAATRQLEGSLGRKIETLKTQLVEMLAHVEAYIDFPEEDIDPETGQALRERCRTAETEVANLLQTADRGRFLRHGIRTVICGAPNAGKSSLLNLLLGYDRAIVNEAPGTTRDSLEETINLRGLPLRLSDTAGLRESPDQIEQEGIRRTQKLIEEADLILLVHDRSAPRPDDNRLAELETKAHCITLLNKDDLPPHPDWASHAGLPFSCSQNHGINALEEKIMELAFLGGSRADDALVAINERHQQALKKAHQALIDCGHAMDSHLPPELVAEELRAALHGLEEVIGKTDVEEILDHIFGSFCIGK